MGFKHLQSCMWCIMLSHKCMWCITFPSLPLLLELFPFVLTSLLHLCYMPLCTCICLTSNPETNGWDTYLTYQSKHLATMFSQHPTVPSLPVRKYGWHTLSSTPNSPAQGLGCPSSRGSSRYNPDILVTHPFCNLCPLGFPFSPTPVPTPPPAPLPADFLWLRVMSTLASPRCLCLWLFSAFYLW